MNGIRDRHMWLWRWNSRMRMMLNRMMTLGEILWVDWIYSIFTQTPVEESLSRNILDFEFIGIKMTRTIIMQKKFMNRKKVHGYCRYMKNIFENKVMIFCRKRSITNMVDRKSLAIAYCDLLWSFVLWLNKEITKIGSEMIWGTRIS